MKAVDVNGLGKAWGNTQILDDISFSVEAGSFAALLGPSGCGKSTTLRIIAGLDEATSGTVEIAGEDVTSWPAAKRAVAMVFQSYALFPHLSVRENILFGPKVRRVPRESRNARLTNTAELLGLTPLLERKPAQLSGGQQQRVALARAIIAETPVCLMDEPLSNLDAQLRAEMRRELRALQQRLRMTVIYVTHDQVEAMTMADQIILMNGGRIEQAAKPAEIYERPASVFAAKFVGTPPMNVLPADAVAAVCSDGLNAPNGRDRKGLLLGIRPESVRLAETGAPAEVRAIEYLGAETMIEASLAGASVLARLSGRPPCRVGDRVHLAWQPDATHWFDMSTGRRIQC
ncbi:MAG: sn-glycerol 3-phosphate transport system ATP-binding protein [Methylobacteriaceae bacterium]|nr:sn-glycerol 3-phosphate transport system ATP-binding protein [Methylobacteriaceae bacterium]